MQLDSTYNKDARLLTSVAQQLRVLLLQVARASELAGESTPSTEQLLAMQRASQFGLQLVDHYLLGLKYHDKQIELLLEPVSLSALLHEVAHELTDVAHNYRSEIELHIAGKYPPVMADRAALKAALMSLGYGLVTNQASTNKRGYVQLAAHRTPHGMVAGIYSDTAISSEDLQRGRILQGHAGQPISAMLPSSGAGIFVADSLLQAMGTTLRGSKFQKRYGLGATFAVSGQLQLI